MIPHLLEKTHGLMRNLQKNGVKCSKWKWISQKMKYFVFWKFHNWSICFCPTNLVSFSKLDPRLSFKKTRLRKYACNVEQEPIKVVKLIFEHPVVNFHRIKLKFFTHLRHDFYKNRAFPSVPWHSLQNFSDFAENDHISVFWAETTKNEVRNWKKIVLRYGGKF